MSETKKAFEYSQNSFFVTKRIVENLAVVPDELLKTLLAIAYYMPNSRPTHDQIIKLTGLSVRTSKYHVKKLESLGFITVYRQHRLANEYQIILGATAIAPKDDNANALGCKKTQVRVQSEAVLGATALAPQHTILNILKHTNENFNFDKNDQELQERSSLAEEAKTLVRRIRSRE